MKYFSQSMTLMGKVTNVDVPDASFTLRCRSGDTFLVQASSQTTYNVLRNLDELGRDRVPSPQGFNANGGPSELVRKYVQPDEILVIYGIYQEHEGKKQFQASVITLSHYEKGRYIFEESHWWLTQ
ncbi:MAG: N-acyl-D-glucosamine 2-epimerase, partial [Anaerolineaceae bacterium]|nr:N-acyl-D-glucosamine 2-epimerase [Anaerolineaceae bacterium]